MKELKTQDKMKEEIKEEQKRNILTFFLLFFPTLLVAAIPTEINGALWVSFGLKLMVILYQFVAIKNFVDIHYS